MNRLQKVSTLAVGIVSLACSISFAQAGPAVPPPAAVAPAAIPAKIALIAFEQAVLSTNEGQKVLADLDQKYTPQKTKVQAEQTEIDSLQKQLQAATNITDDDRANRIRTIDTKQKTLQRDGEDAQAAYQNDLQEAYQRVAGKVNVVLQKYLTENGYTLGLDVGGQASPVIFAAQQTDVTRAVIDAYNTSSGVAAPAAGAAPSAPRQSTTTPRTTAPKAAPAR